MSKRRRQHSKGRKRPRAWHRSVSSSRIYDRRLRELEAAFARAEAGAR